jgi:outer membrane immunogenic protein
VGGELGINVLISQRAYAGFSIDYADLGSFQGLNFQRRHVAVSVGTRF